MEPARLRLQWKFVKFLNANIHFFLPQNDQCTEKYKWRWNGTCRTKHDDLWTFAQHLVNNQQQQRLEEKKRFYWDYSFSPLLLKGACTLRFSVAIGCLQYCSMHLPYVPLFRAIVPKPFLVFNTLIILGGEKVGFPVRKFRMFFTVTVTVQVPLFLFIAISIAYLQITNLTLHFGWWNEAAAGDSYIGKVSFWPPCIYM